LWYTKLFRNILKKNQIAKTFFDGKIYSDDIKKFMKRVMRTFFPWVWKTVVLIPLFTLLMLFLGGFLVFLVHIYTLPIPHKTFTDGFVVLTGFAKRIPEALNLVYKSYALNPGKTLWLRISGAPYSLKNSLYEKTLDTLVEDSQWMKAWDKPSQSFKNLKVQRAQAVTGSPLLHNPDHPNALKEQEERTTLVSGGHNPFHHWVVNYFSFNRGDKNNPSLTFTQPSIHISFGKNPRNTYENILDIQKWARENHLRSITIITSNYHMPRVMLLAKAMISSDIRLVAYPIHHHLFYPIILFREYYKYVFFLLGGKNLSSALKKAHSKLSHGPTALKRFFDSNIPFLSQIKKPLPLDSFSDITALSTPKKTV
jgi:uncharacterized SAM-binding protein YcdF (DUF218 family)